MSGVGLYPDGKAGPVNEVELAIHYCTPVERAEGTCITWIERARVASRWPLVLLPNYRARLSQRLRDALVSLRAHEEKIITHYLEAYSRHRRSSLRHPHGFGALEYHMGTLARAPPSPGGVEPDSAQACARSLFYGTSSWTEASCVALVRALRTALDGAVDQYSYKAFLATEWPAAAYEDRQSTVRPFENVLIASGALPTDKEVVECPLCCHQLPSRQEVARHLGTHHGYAVNHFTCSVCHSRQVSADALVKHLRSAHKILSDDKRVCNQLSVQQRLAWLLPSVAVDTANMPLRSPESTGFNRVWALAVALMDIVEHGHARF